MGAGFEQWRHGKLLLQISMSGTLRCGRPLLGCSLNQITRLYLRERFVMVVTTLSPVCSECLHAEGSASIVAHPCRVPRSGDVLVPIIHSRRAGGVIFREDNVQTQLPC